MVVEVIIAIKVAIIAIVYFFHHIQGRFIKGALLGVLLFLGIPDMTDLFLQPMFAQITGLEMPLSVIVYFGVIWAAIIIVFIVL